MKAFDTQTGQPVEVPEADFPQLLSAGKVGLPAGTLVHLQGEDGIESVPVEQALDRAPPY